MARGRADALPGNGKGVVDMQDFTLLLKLAIVLALLLTIQAIIEA